MMEENHLLFRGIDNSFSASQQIRKCINTKSSNLFSPEGPYKFTRNLMVECHILLVD